MSQSNNVIYYTTAQVTNMVELSDQNVRKYVRLLEDRNYEVAKDEHNRRLFSKKDVNVLQEMIRIAKSPGNTLESAADQIIENMDDYEEAPSENQVSNMSESDVTRLLTLVLEKLDEIQNENKELKSNISTLVHRLEEYDLKALEYEPVETEVEESAELEETISEETITPETTTEEIVVKKPEEGTGEVEEETTEEEPPTLEEEVAADIETEEEIDPEIPAVEETEDEAVEETVETESTNTGTIDLSAERAKKEDTTVEDTTVKEDTPKSEEIPKFQKEEPKGFFGKLASIFKG